MRTHPRILLLSAALIVPALLAQEREWKAGPGTMHFAQLATLTVPVGYSYQERAIDPSELKRGPAVKGSLAPVNLGMVKKGILSQIAFSYAYDPSAGLDQLIWRTNASRNVHTLADRMVQLLRGKGQLSARVLESDHYDFHTATLTYQVGFDFGVGLRAPITARKRVIIYFLRHGAVIVEFTEVYLGGSVEMQSSTLLRGLSLSPDETPGWVARTSFPTASELGASWPHALTGLLIGAGVALFIHRRRSTPPSLTALPGFMSQSV